MVPESGEPYDMEKFGRGLFPEVDANRLKKKKSTRIFQIKIIKIIKIFQFYTVHID